MAITPNIVIAERCMAGNPIIVKLYAGANTSKQFRIYGGTAYGTLVYEGLIYTITDTYSEIDLSSLFKAITSFQNYKIVLVDDDVEVDTTYFTTYPGAISKLMQRALTGSDIFAAKLKNVTQNFFLTSRTADRIILIPEDEILSLSYYAKGLKFSVMVEGHIIAVYDHSASTEELMAVLDIIGLRDSQTFYTLCNSFDIVTDTGYSCSVVITDAGQRTDFFLKFKNSWGVTEMIGIRGDVDYTPTFAEVVKLKQYDATVNDFITNQQRKELTNIFTATTGFKTDDERLFLLDMLMSNDVTLIAYGREYAVNVTTDTNLFATTKAEPASMNLIIELKDLDNAFSPIVISPVYETLTTTTLEEIEANGSTIIV